MTKENNLPKFTIKQLLEAGVHFGHKTMRRNTKMSKYIYGVRNGLSIIDLGQSANLLYNALKVVKEVAKNNGRILFVATKKQAVDVVAEAATRCGQYYVNHRWLGGMLTNWKTVSASIKTLRKIEDQLANDEIGLNKKERLVLERKRNKLEMTLGGIKNIGGYPDLIFVIDTHRECLAIAEAKNLGIPIIAILDSNSNPTGITYPIPGNDDSVKAIKLYCRLLSDAILIGIKENMAIAGVDVDKLENASAVIETVKKSNEGKKLKIDYDSKEDKDIDKSKEAEKKSLASKDKTKKTEKVKEIKKAKEVREQKTFEKKDAKKSPTSTKKAVVTKKPSDKINKNINRK